MPCGSGGAQHPSSANHETSKSSDEFIGYPCVLSEFGADFAPHVCSLPGLVSFFIVMLCWTSGRFNFRFNLFVHTDSGRTFQSNVECSCRVDDSFGVSKDVIVGVWHS
jgi:hypothetical protein